MKVNLLTALLLLILSQATFSATIFQEDFESYALNAWPSPWVKDANANQSATNKIIQDDGSSNKILKLYGDVGGCWGALAYYPCAFQDEFYVEAKVRNGSETLSGCHPFRAGFGMRHGTYWYAGTNPAFTLILFKGTTLTGADASVLVSNYKVNQWYNIKVHYKRSGSQVTINYWVDGQHRGESVQTVDVTTQQMMDHFEICSQEGSVYFDDIKVYTNGGGSDEWSFVHMTDTHVGYTNKKSVYGKNISRGRLAAAVDNIVETVNPKFIVVTGDIAEYGCEDDGSQCPGCKKDSKSLYDDFLLAMDPALKEGIKVITVPGNHDRYSDCDGLEWYSTGLAGVSNLTACVDTYSWEQDEVLFVGLDSGEGISGNGIEEGIWDQLETEFSNSTKAKVLFMHHPVYEDLWGNWSFTERRDAFLSLCDPQNNNNVKLVLAGHTHRDRIHSMDGDLLNVGSNSSPQFVQTPSTCKEGNDDVPGYRVIQVDQTEMRPQAYTLVTEYEKNYSKAEMYSPASLHIYDAVGSHVGLQSNGEVTREIERSYYFYHHVLKTDDGEEVLPEEIIIFDPTDDYIYQSVGNAAASYHLLLTINDEGQEFVVDANNIPTLPNAVHEYLVDWEALRQGLPGVLIQIDMDGDGEFESEVLTDATVDGNDIAVTPESTMFTPQTLNCGSKGKWIKTHIILPKDISLADVDVTIPAKIEQLEIYSVKLDAFVNEEGYVQIDGIYDRNIVCAALEAFEEDSIELTVSARLKSGMYIIGKDMITLNK